MVESAAFSPDGSRVVTASADGTARVWDAATGAPVAGPLKHDREVESAAFSPDGSRIVTASHDGTARVWDAATGAPLTGPLKHDRPVESAVFSPDGSRVITASRNGTAQVWDAATGAPLASPLKHDGPVTSVAFSPDGSRVVTASQDGTARVLRVLETGPLSVWAKQAQQCIATRADAIGSSSPCPLQDHDSTPSEVLAQVRSMMLAGDAATFSRVARLPRADYRRALDLLDRNRDDIMGTYQADAQKLHWAISVRLALLDAVEDHLLDARAHVGISAPAADADLLHQLGGFAHEELNNDTFALPLISQARALGSKQEDLFLGLAEVYFAAGRYDDFARTTTQIDKPSLPPNVRIAMAALSWAVAWLTHAQNDVQRAHLVEAYQKIANGMWVSWSWKGTKHALTYGHLRYEDVKPVIDVLELLEHRVTDETRSKLIRLVQKK